MYPSELSRKRLLLRAPRYVFLRGLPDFGSGRCVRPHSSTSWRRQTRRPPARTAIGSGKSGRTAYRFTVREWTPSASATWESEKRSSGATASEPNASSSAGVAMSVSWRNGTTSLYAALEIATGEVTGACYPQHRHQEFIAFLNQLVRAYPRRPLHVVLDNSSTHSTPEVERWLERHKRVHFHFTPTSASWMNMVEIWFSILTNQQVRRGAYRDVPELIAAIEHFIDGYNQRAQPFVWTKSPEQILAKAIKQQGTSETLP